MGTCSPLQRLSLPRTPFGVLSASLSRIPALTRPRHPWLRRGGDSNPRYPLGVQRLSRAPDSATLAPLQILTSPRGKTSRCLCDPLNPPPYSADSCSDLASVTRGLGKSDRRGRDSNPRNRGAAQRFSRPPPSTTRTPLPSNKKRARRGKLPTAEQQRILRSPRTVHYNYRPELCQ